MKKKFLYGIAVLIISVVAAVNVNLSSKGNGLSDVSFANVEALAGAEKTTEELAALGCEPVWEQEVCHANDNDKYMFARNL